MRANGLPRRAAIVWLKSSHSTAHGEDCVEVAALPHRVVGLRDSKDPEGRRLTLTPAAWRALAYRTKAI
ncbi:DUF397 domain-containing protein [Actinomadura harenae]|uniref:DUF397 domain-containing protein n=1 Tax=Actinomadura harenae TaxID=2483351 RepID=A0A3M2LP72_9ACTN|nr:DUF397 domain-containing protein [Actinomadura harenae]RMI38896.1 DUF397 domain-containing protein [Actinomadura harenae]